MKPMCIIIFFAISSCSFLDPDPGPENSTNQNSTSSNSGSSSSSSNSGNFNYIVNYSGPVADPYYAICSINCDIITSTTDINCLISSLSTNGSLLLSWNSTCPENPYFFIYTLDPGGSGCKKYLAIASASSQNQTISVNLTPLNARAVYTNNSSTNICVQWDFWIGDNNAFFYIDGYMPGNVTVWSSQLTGISGSGIIINSYGHFDVWLGLKGWKFYLDGANATAH